ncbi:MAG: hypothetical protein P8X60_04795, partial [Robiginitalea sp.]
TEFGMFVSMDDGKAWMPFQQNLPVTPITDIKIHRGDLVLSTMGRAFWILDNISPMREEGLNSTGALRLLKPQKAIRSRMPSGARGSRTPEYPRPAVFLDYVLPAESTETLKLEIRDMEGQVLTAYSSDSIPGPIGGAVRDMGTNFTEFLVTESLTCKKGLNRFRWDMTQAGPWNKSDNRRYRSGPMVKPGTYTAVLSVGNLTSSQSFELEMDPRVLAAGVSEADVSAQVDFQLKIRDKISETLRLEEAIEKEIATLEEDASEQAKEGRLQTLKATLAEIKTAEGIYMQPMLADQWQYLYYMMGQADQLPGKDALDRYDELSAGLEDLKKRL